MTRRATAGPGPTTRASVPSLSSSTTARDGCTRVDAAIPGPSMRHLAPVVHRAGRREASVAATSAEAPPGAGPSGLRRRHRRRRSGKGARVQECEPAPRCSPIRHPRNGHSRSSRSTITSSSPRTCSRAACRRALAEQRARGRHARRRPRDVGLRGRLLPAGRAQRRRRPAEGRVEHGAGALRRDAPRLLRHRGARRRHGPRRRATRRCASRRSSPGSRARSSRKSKDPELGLACAAGVERLAHRGVGRPAPRPRHPAAARVAERSRDRGGRRPRQRRARLQGGQLPREPGRPEAAVDARPTLGSVPARVRGDRDGRVPAQRVVVVDRGALAGRAARAVHEPVPGERAGRRGRLAVGAASRPASRTSRSRSPRAASAGCRC